jgi:hypothetical protein
MANYELGAVFVLRGTYPIAGYDADRLGRDPAMRWIVGGKAIERGGTSTSQIGQFGDLERCALRPGNVHSAHDWRDVLEPVITRYRGKQLRRFFRGDAAFALPDIYEFLEAEGFGYAIRLPANTILQGNIAHLLKRPVGRPPKEVRRYYANFSYRAASWTRARRVGRTSYGESRDKQIASETDLSHFFGGRATRVRSRFRT